MPAIWVNEYEKLKSTENLFVLISYGFVFESLKRIGASHFNYSTYLSMLLTQWEGKLVSEFPSELAVLKEDFKVSRAACGLLKDSTGHEKSVNTSNQTIAITGIH
jgi:hypothetical protein